MTRPVLYTGDIFRLQARGGITRYFTEVIRRLARPVRVVAGLHQSRELGSLGERVRVAAYVAPFRGSPRLRALVNRCVDALSLGRNGQAILHPTYYRDPASLERNLPVVATVYDMAHERFPALFRRRFWNSKDPARWKAALCSRADRIVCISESTRRDLVEFLRVPESKLRVIHCGRTSWGMVVASGIPGAARPFFLWVGERHTYKNFDATLRAWGGCGVRSEIDLLCVGGGPFRDAERAAIAAIGAGAQVTQRDCPDAELKWAYERAVGLLYTSRCEGFGLPIVEAMSLGCPVVAANVSSLPEVAGDAAILVDPADLESIRAGIERCAASERSEALAKRLRAQAATFSWDACAAAHEALYRELA